MGGPQKHRSQLPNQLILRKIHILYNNPQKDWNVISHNFSSVLFFYLVESCYILHSTPRFSHMFNLLPRLYKVRSPSCKFVNPTKHCSILYPINPNIHQVKKSTYPSGGTSPTISSLVRGDILPAFYLAGQISALGRCPPPCLSYWKSAWKRGLGLVMSLFGDLFHITETNICWIWYPLSSRVMWNITGHLPTPGKGQTIWEKNAREVWWFSLNVIFSHSCRRISLFSSI